MSKLALTLTQKAVNLFTKRPNATGLTRIMPSGTRVQVLNKGNYLEKTIFKANGSTITSQISKDGKHVAAIKEVTKNGKICHSYGAQNYDKVVEVQKNDGTIFNFLGHTDRPNGILYSNVNGRYMADNKYMPQFNEAMQFIRGKNSQSKYSQLIEELRKQWL